MCDSIIPATYEYSAACLPNSVQERRNYCILHIVSETAANVEIHTSQNSSSFTLSAGEQYRRELDEYFHPTLNLEDKAIRIKSNAEIQVLVHKRDSNNDFHDVYMVSNQIRNTDQYFTAAYVPSNEDGQCTKADSFKQFYLVTSFYDGTFVNITQQDGATYELELPNYGTFVRTTTYINDHLAVGTEIIASKPINVLSGNLCLINPAIDSHISDAYVSNIPTVDTLGRKYVIPKIISDDFDYYGGYSISVVATEDNTTVESEGDVQTLDQGEMAIFEYKFINRSPGTGVSRSAARITVL